MRVPTGEEGVSEGKGSGGAVGGEVGTTGRGRPSVSTRSGFGTGRKSPREQLSEGGAVGREVERNGFEGGAGEGCRHDFFFFQGQYLWIQRRRRSRV